MVTVASATERSQLMNRDEARARLTALLRDAVAPPPAAAGGNQAEPRGARERRLDDKRRRAQTKRNRRYEPGEVGAVSGNARPSLLASAPASARPS